MELLINKLEFFKLNNLFSHSAITTLFSSISELFIIIGLILFLIIVFLTFISLLLKLRALIDLFEIYSKSFIDAS